MKDRFCSLDAPPLYHLVSTAQKPRYVIAAAMQRYRAESQDDLLDVRGTSESSTTPRIGQSTMDTGLRRLCQSTQSVGLDDQVATGVSDEAPDMLQLSTDPEKLAMYAPLP